MTVAHEGYTGSTQFPAEAKTPVILVIHTRSPARHKRF